MPDDRVACAARRGRAAPSPWCRPVRPCSSACSSSMTTWSSAAAWPGVPAVGLEREHVRAARPGRSVAVTYSALAVDHAPIVPVLAGRPRAPRGSPRPRRAPPGRTSAAARPVCSPEMISSAVSLRRRPGLGRLLLAEVEDHVDAGDQRDADHQRGRGDRGAARVAAGVEPAQLARHRPGEQPAEQRHHRPADQRGEQRDADEADQHAAEDQPQRVVAGVAGQAEAEQVAAGRADHARRRR